jgi:hypothetical protein
VADRLYRDDESNGACGSKLRQGARCSRPSPNAVVGLYHDRNVPARTAEGVRRWADADMESRIGQLEATAFERLSAGIPPARMDRRPKSRLDSGLCGREAFEPFQRTALPSTAGRINRRRLAESIAKAFEKTSALAMNPECVALIQTIVLLAQTIVLALTAILVWRYTKATEKYTDEAAALRREAVRQTKISLRPLVLPEFTSAQGQLHFELRNCGVGSAVNLVLPNITTNHYAAGEINFGMIESRFAPIAYLPSGERVQVGISTFADGAALGAESMFRDWFHPRRPGPEITIQIQFQDIEARRYRLRVTVNAEHVLGNLPRSVIIGAIEEIP